ncbi:LysR family transcriptional regulator [Budvicia aquatica]|uniref:LysR family transcriptional regulator n=1 Tax=Budvicia aquatica TaxID=82979 RepID=UPI00208CA999|nr:LysR family transcriptional regulator [Budvicia aquatica]GKX50486.1 LysR family transcriptional regulator [Budvicia aquatica]
MDLNLVHVFVAVVDRGSFVGAATMLSLPTSNVSRYISQLEKQLNCRLLERSTRNMRITEAGKLLYQHAKPLLESLELAELILTSQQAVLSGTLKLCLPGEFGPGVLGPILADFAQSHPQVEIQCNTGLPGSEILRDDIDLAIVFNRGLLDNSSLIARKIASMTSVVVASPELLKQIGIPKLTRQLKQLPCVTTLSVLKGQPWQFIDKSGSLHKVAVSSRYKVNSGELARTAALRGIGLAILAESGCRDDIESGRLVKVEFEMVPAPLELLALYPSRQYVPARVRLFLELVQKRLAELG